MAKPSTRGNAANSTRVPDISAPTGIANGGALLVMTAGSHCNRCVGARSITIAPAAVDATPHAKPCSTRPRINTGRE